MKRIIAGLMLLTLTVSACCTTLSQVAYAANPASSMSTEDQLKSYIYAKTTVSDCANKSGKVTLKKTISYAGLSGLTVRDLIDGAGYNANISDYYKSSTISCQNLITDALKLWGLTVSDFVKAVYGAETKEKGGGVTAEAVCVYDTKVSGAGKEKKPGISSATTYMTFVGGKWNYNTGISSLNSDPPVVKSGSTKVVGDGSYKDSSANGAKKACTDGPVNKNIKAGTANIKNYKTLPAGSSKATRTIKSSITLSTLSTMLGGVYPTSGTPAVDKLGNYTFYEKLLTVNCGMTLGEKDPSKSSVSEYAVSYIDGDTVKKGVASATKNKDSEEYTLVSGSGALTNGKQTCKTIAGRMSSAAGEAAAILKATGKTIAVTTTTTGTVPADEPSSCNIGSALGWIICPASELLGGIVDGIYEWIADNFIVIKADVFTNSATSDAWKTFRNIANVGFIILFIVVIFSQLTGVGITNYGIKKLLPKIIITALLVNLSYFICQICVDLSNIVGDQAYKLLSNGVTVETFTGGPSGGVIALILGGAAVGVVLFGALGGLLILLLGCLLAILMTFVILIVRQAAVILLVVVAPVAFICYMLPNTEGLFKKWKDIFKAMLLLYPIIGVAMGAGLLAGSIIQKQTGTLFTLIGVACTILPLFALPYLIKGSMAALGALGAKISGLQNAGRGLRAKGLAKTKAAPGNSLLGKRAQMSYRDRSLRAQQRFYDSGFAQGLGGRAAERKLSGIEAAQQKIKDEEFGNLQTSILNSTNKGEVGQLDSEFRKALASGDSDRAKAIVEIAGQDKFKAKQIAKTFKDSSDIDDKTLRTVSKQMASGSGSKNYRAADATSFEYASMVNGVKEGDSLGNLASSFGQAKAAGGGALSEDSSFLGTVKDKHINNGSDFYSQSGDTIKAMINGGQVTAENVEEYREYAKKNGGYDDSKEGAINEALGQFTSGKNQSTTPTSTWLPPDASGRPYGGPGAPKGPDDSAFNVPHGNGSA
ncbi:MAG: hypothetical protein LBG75_01420 [Candidatus Nomurabacteria bacterium]|nr:hypothetical protein [Candidatus Nomurabacteria bacterium]